MILYLIIPKIYPKIPLINNVQLKYYGCFDFGNKWVSENIEVFKQFDDKKIIIDATSPTRNGAAILYIAILITLALFDFYPKVYDNLLDGDIWGLLKLILFITEFWMSEVYYLQIMITS